MAHITGWGAFTPPLPALGFSLIGNAYIGGGPYFQKTTPHAGSDRPAKLVDISSLGNVAYILKYARKRSGFDNEKNRPVARRRSPS